MLNTLLIRAFFFLGAIQDRSNITPSLSKHHGTPVFAHLTINLAKTGTRLREFVNQMQATSTIHIRNMHNKLLDSTRVSHPQHSLNFGQRNFLSAIGNGLVKQAKSITHTTSSSTSN